MHVLLAALLACSPDPVASDPPPATEPIPTSTPTVEPPAACPAPFTISEILPSNAQGLTDEDGDHGDWLELDGAASTLAGWSIVPGDGDPWPLPDVPLEGPRLVWADGKDRAGDALHAPFSLSPGDTLAIVDAAGCVAERLAIPAVHMDDSWGTSAGGRLIFDVPTPGAPNDTEGRPGYAPTPKIATPHGFTAGNVDVGVDVPAGTTATYTLDGSVPPEDGAPIAGPIAIDAADQPVVVRARAFADGLWPSTIATATYGESAEPISYGVRVISLTVDPPDLWDELTGIYVPGPGAEPSYPYFGANFWQPWERSAHVEIWGPDGEPLVDQDAGIQIAGGYSRAFDQRNFELVARGGYGDGTFSAKLFHDEDIAEFGHLYLRNGGDWCGTQIVDATVQALLRDPAGVRLPSADAQAYEPALVYLNGAFWGVYELKERLDVDWPAAHRGADPDATDLMKLGWTHVPSWDLEAGDWTAWDELEALATTSDLSDPAAWADFERRVDLVNFATAIAAQGWIGNTDWWTNNLRMWRKREGDVRFRWMVYDFGHGWPAWDYDHLGTSVATSQPGMRVADALENEAFRVILANVHADLLNTSMAGPAAEATVASLADEVRPVMPQQRVRWCGGSPAMDGWESSVAYAEDFARNRAAAMDADVVRYLAPAGHARLTLAVDPPGSGTFALTAVTVEPPFTGTWYRDTPVPVTALPADGWTFAGWSDPALGADPSIVLPMDGDEAVTAIFVPGP